MKKLFALLLFVLFVSVYAFSQTAARKYEYAIAGSYGERVIIDYGNNRSEDFKEVMKSRLKGKEYTKVDALNYMDEQGYELVSAMLSSQDNYKFVFKREIKK